VIPRLLLDTAAVPGGGELKLFRRGDEFSIMLGATELMNSRKSGSEEALATLACAALAGRTAPRMLIGGLGMGFTLRAALTALPAGAAVTVAELVPAVVAWARGPMAHLQQGSLDDPRVTVREGDVAPLIADAPTAWDAILLDVDNGPGGITAKSNDGLYGPAGLLAARRALRPAGVLAVWSSAPDAAFTARLRRAGFGVEEHIVRGGKSGKGPRHVIWIAAAPGQGLQRP
jgi:spermidine synthase